MAGSRANPLATPGEHLVSGRRWYTECDTARTGRNGCRAYIWDGRQFVFNNIVHFGQVWANLEALYQWRPGPSSPPPPAGTYDLTRGPNTSDKVMLTFDDCPKTLAHMKATAVAARDLGVSLALFPTGNCITQGRFDAAYARSMGHYVFNHSITHPYLTRLTYSQMVRELGAPGVVTTYGRPPFGDYNATVRKAYGEVGMRIWLWTLDTFDYRGKTHAELVARVVRDARKGDTVLMHMQWNGFNGVTIKAMRDGLAARGIGVCQNQGPVVESPAGVAC